MYIIDDPDMTLANPTFSDSVDEESSDAESFNEDDMYGLDPCMMVMSELSDDGEVDMKELSDGGDEVDLSNKSNHGDDTRMSETLVCGDDVELSQGTGSVSK